MQVSQGLGLGSSEWAPCSINGRLGRQLLTRRRRRRV